MASLLLYDMYLNFRILINVGIKSNILTLELWYIVGMFVVSINAGAQVAIFTHLNCIWTGCGHKLIVGIGLYLG